MNIKSLEISNICKIRHTVIEINNSLNLFFGTIKQGKSTILHSVELLFGGAFSEDLLTHGENSGFVRMNLLPIGYIKRSFFRDEDGKTRSKPKIEYINTEGDIVQTPVPELKKLLNPFLQDQNFFINMTTFKKTKYFAELFNVDISDIETKQTKIKDENKSLRIKIKLYGDIDTTLVEKPEVDELKKQQTKLIENRKKEENGVDKQNKIIDLKNVQIDIHTDRLKEINLEVESINRALQKLDHESSIIEKYLSDKTKLDLLPYPTETAAAIKEIEEKITNARISEVLYKQYLVNVKKDEQRKNDKQDLTNNLAADRKLQNEKIERLATLSKKTGIKKLEFDSEAHAIYENTSIDLLSGSQLKKLSSALARLYPNDLGLELLDAAECLGDSIYEYIGEAKNNSRTILATIVGNAPSKIPEQIGVWVVSEGNVEKKN